MNPFFISCIIPAARPLVWQAWTEESLFSQWWGPAGCTVFHCRMDVHPGKMAHYGLRDPDGRESRGRNVYREVDPMSWLVFINSFTNPEGAPIRHPFHPGWPLEMLTTVSFDDHNAGTVLTVRWLPEKPTPEELAVFDAGRDAMHQGWTGTLDRLGSALSTTTCDLAQDRQLHPLHHPRN